MDKNARDRLLGLLRDGFGSESGRRVVMRVVSNISDDEISRIVRECEEMAAFRNWLSESEARDIVAGFVSLDGSRGPHWGDADAMFAAVEAIGFSPDNAPGWNRWAWFATMNMIWSDEWGVLSSHIDQSEEARVCAELTKARLEDPDGGFVIRRYFGLDL